MVKQQQRIFIKGEEKTDQIKQYRLRDGKVDITFSSGKTYSYNRSNVEIVDSVLVKPNAGNCFEYLTEIAQVAGLNDESGENILANRFNKIDFIEPDSILAAFLTGRSDNPESVWIENAIYPFGFNITLFREVRFASADIFVANSELQMYCLVAFRSPIG